MTTTAGLIVFLLLYALTAVVLGFNLWGASDQLAEHWRGKPWLYRQIGRDSPMAWRAGGLMMLAFGATVVVWILVSGMWQLPSIAAEAAVLVLGLVLRCSPYAQAKLIRPGDAARRDGVGSTS